MRIDTKQIDFAILKIFYDSRVQKGEGLRIDSLLDSWAATQLRERDLYSGLKHLNELGCLEAEGQNPKTLVTLTEIGFAKTMELKSLLKEMTNLMTGRYLASLLKRFVTGSKTSKTMCRKSDSLALP